MKTAKEFFCDWMHMEEADFLPGDFYFVKCMEAHAREAEERGIERGKIIERHGSESYIE